MGFFSNFFGGKKEDPALKAALDHIHRIIDDEKYQLELINPVMMEKIKSAPSFDQDPNGTGPFGMSENNPIPVNGPLGELAYLSRIETLRGERLLFHRVGAVNTIDVFEAVTFSGSEWFVFFLDFYHPRRSRALPEGFRFTKDVPQFSGFNNFCDNFPYDFAEMKQSQQESGLSMAYIALSKVTEQIKQQAFKRPLAHKAKLDLVHSRLTSSRLQKPKEDEDGGTGGNIFVDAATAEVQWVLSRNHTQLTTSGAMLTVLLLTAAQEGWRHGVLISTRGEMLAVNIESCAVTDRDARELSRVLRSKMKPNVGNDGSPEMDQLFKLLDFFGQGAFSILRP